MRRNGVNVSTLESLTAEVDAIHNRYRRGFAGRSRATRDLAALDTLIAELERLASQVPAEAVILRQTIEERARLYKEERAAIAQIQSAGPDAQSGWRLAEWSEVTFYRYRRDFAGQMRPTRDSTLLMTMADEQRQWLNSMPALANTDASLKSQKDQMERNLKLYADEQREIVAALKGARPDERARLLATLANQQFGLYKLHFSGKNRASRRPRLLRRIISALQSIHADMVALRDQGVKTDAHVGNIQKVADRIRFNQGELQQVEQARAQTTAQNLAGLLGDDANRVLNEYRNTFADKPRSTANAAKLSELCEELQEIARNMSDLDTERPTEINRRNLGIVLDMLKMYEREWDAISKAQQKR